MLHCIFMFQNMIVYMYRMDYFMCCMWWKVKSQPVLESRASGVLNEYFSGVPEALGSSPGWDLTFHHMRYICSMWRLLYISTSASSCNIFHYVILIQSLWTLTCIILVCNFLEFTVSYLIKYCGISSLDFWESSPPVLEIFSTLIYFIY